MIPGLMMYPGGVGGRRSVASQLAAYPNLSAYFEAGLGETTDPGPPVKVSQLVSPIYVDPGGGPIVSPRSYIQSIDEALFASMPLRDTTGWGGGLESLALKDGSTNVYLYTTLAASIAPPWGFQAVVEFVAVGIIQRLSSVIGPTTYRFITNAGDRLAVDDGTAYRTLSDAPLTAGKHLISILHDGSGLQAWIDGVAQTPSASAAITLSGTFYVGFSGNSWRGLVRSVGLYIGNWTTDGTRAGLESFLNSRAGGGII